VKKKVLVCAYFAKNLGDDLFLKILFDRYPNVEWDLLTANRNYNEIFKDYKNVKIIYSYRNIGKNKFNLFFKLNDMFFKYKKYDALVNIGGSIFMQSPAWKLKFNEREYLLNNFKKRNKKVFILGANFGPFKDKVFVEKYRKLFATYNDVCFRDYYSYKIFSDLENVRLAPDVVFNLDVKRFDEKEKSVGFSIIDIEKREGLNEYQHEYNKKLTQLVENYIELGYKVKLFSFCENEGDMKAINYLQDSFKKNYSNSIEVIDYEGNINSFLNKFKSCEVIIGTRFHSIILALLYNQSVFPIIYSEKTYNVLKDLNMENHCCYIQDIQKLDVKKVTTSIDNRMKNSEVFVEAEKQFEKLDLFLGNFNLDGNKLEKGRVVTLTK
jgi:colanic acid/amylovoran biosynthesis protein